MYSPIIPTAISVFNDNNTRPTLTHITQGATATNFSHIIRRPVNTERLPFLITCPHAGLITPEGFEKTLAADTSLLEFLARGDVFTDWLTAHAPHLGATQIISTVSPSYLNVGRATTSINPNDVRSCLTELPYNLNDIYVKGGQGQGLVAVKTLYGNKPIYAEGQAPDEAEIAQRITQFYDPFHQALEQQVTGNLDKHGYSLLFDIHSCPSTGTPKDKDAGDPRHDIILSNKAEGNSCSSELIDKTRVVAEEAGFSVQVNYPYTGGFNTQKYARHPSGFYEDMPFGERGSESLQIEFSRAAFGFNEETLEIEDMAAFLKMQRTSALIMDTMAQYVRRQIDMQPR